MKKVLSLLVAAMMILSMFSALTVFADDNTVVVDGVTFSKNMQILVKYPVDKTDESYTIPNSVTIIGNNAFSENHGRVGNKYLKNIIIPDSVTSIGEYAFSGCTSLIKVNIPDSITNIGMYAFSGCANLETVVLPKNLTEVPWYLFSGCSSLKDVIIPDCVTNIGVDAFRACTELESIIIPDSVTQIWSNAFYGCTGLKNVTLSKNIHNLTGFSGCTALEYIVIPEEIDYISNDAFKGCISLKSVTIPESVTHIYNNAFDGCTLLTDVYYGATKIEWDSIEIDAGNGFLQTANIHFTEPDKSEIKVTVNGKKLSFDQAPIIENGRTLVPLRAIFEALNATIAWDGETQTVRAIRYNTYIEIKIGSNEMVVNNEIKYLDVPAKTINGRTMVPARAVAEAFNCNVSWDEENNTVIIN